MNHCKFCDSKFESKHGLNTHKSMVHDANIVPCDNCDDDVKKALNKIERDNNHFCSDSCRSEWRSSLTGEDSPAWSGGPVDKICEFCEDEYCVKQAEAEKSRFCSLECMALWKSENWRGEDCPNWEGGHQKDYGPLWNRIRSEVRERDEVCQICEMSIEKHINKYGRRPDVHHKEPIESFDSFERANDKSNLIMLCRDCHAKVECGKREIEAVEPAR